MKPTKESKVDAEDEKWTQSSIYKQIKCFVLSGFKLLRYYVDLLIDKLFGLCYNSQRIALPNANNPIVLESAVSLAEKIRKRELTSEEIVQAFVDRINQVNAVVNAVVDTCFEEALEEARAVDQAIKNGLVNEAGFEKKPFLGVPFTSKETSACKGMSFTLGLVCRKSCKATSDCEIIERVKSSGAILIAVTNIPELAMWMETSNHVYGITRNPYNTTRHVGGSSGGEGCIVAAGGTPFGLGTDIGGSLRMPCFMCGIYGHKPSPYLTSTKGLSYRTYNEEETMVGAGPMARSAQDLAPLMKVLAGPNVDKLTLDQPVDVRKLKIYYVTDPKDPKISPMRTEMRGALLRCVKHFQEVSAEKPQEISIPELKYAGKVWSYWMSQEVGAENFNSNLTNRQGRVNSFWEILKICLRQSDYTLGTGMMLLGRSLSKVNATWAREQTDVLRKKMTTYLDSNSVLLYPSSPLPASYHNSSVFRPRNFFLFCIWSALKFPATQVPLGLSEEGMPLGIQIVAAPFNDHLNFAVAKELERAFGGYVPPFIVENK